MRREKVESCGRDASLASSSARRDRRCDRQASVRLEACIFSGEPFRRSVSGWENEGEQDAVVCVRSESCESVTERDELVGRLRTVSRLPQYLPEHQLIDSQRLFRREPQKFKIWEYY